MKVTSENQKELSTQLLKEKCNCKIDELEKLKNL